MKNYECRLFQYEDYWVCEYPDLPGCSGVGDTPKEALAEGKVASELWLEDLLLNNQYNSGEQTDQVSEE